MQRNDRVLYIIRSAAVMVNDRHFIDRLKQRFAFYIAGTVHIHHHKGCGRVRQFRRIVSHQEQIGVLYPQVLETLVRGACRELFA